MKSEISLTLILVLFCLVVLALCLALGFHTYLTAKEAKERKQYADRMVAAVETATEKIPEFSLFNRKKNNEDSSGNHRWINRRVDR